MRTILRNCLALVLASTVAFGAAALLPSKSDAAERLASVSAVSCPAVQLKHWKVSTKQEKLAFLFGFATMLEMEKEWQAGAPLSISHSIASSWVRGLSGKTLGDLSNALDQYVAQNPDKMENTVVGVLGRLYVAPAMSQAEKNEARLRYEQIKNNK